MDRNIEQLNNDFERLESAGLLTAKARAKQSKEKDYHTRNGLTKKPIFKKIDLTKVLPPLHFRICSLNHMENFAYIINTPLKKFPNKKRVMRKGNRKGDDCKDAVVQSKKKLIKEAKTTLGLLLDSPNGGGNGGSTDGANNSRIFFSENNREKVLDLFKVNARDRAKIKRIIRDLNVIGRVANSTKKIKVAEFKKFCQEAYVFKIKAFKWPSCPTTLHRGYSHLADIIQLNDGIGLGDISESCLGWEKPSVLNLKIGNLLK